MRLLVVAALLTAALPAAGQAPWAAPRVLPGLATMGSLPSTIDTELPALPRLRLQTALFELAPQLPAATPATVIPPRYGWALDDGRAFWFAAGASSVVALGSHVLIGLPTFLVAGGGALAAAESSPATGVPLLLGVGAAYATAQSAMSALAAVLVFNGISKIYDGNYAVALAAHLAGTVLGSAVSALSFGSGVMLVGGLQGLAQFTGSAGLNAVQVFSLLGALPAVVIGGIALVGVPAIVGAWAMSISATPKAGFSIDPSWRHPAPVAGAAPPAITWAIPELPVWRATGS